METDTHLYYSNYLRSGFCEFPVVAGQYATVPLLTKTDPMGVFYAEK